MPTTALLQAAPTMARRSRLVYLYLLWSTPKSTHCCFHRQERRGREPPGDQKTAAASGKGSNTAGTLGFLTARFKFTRSMSYLQPSDIDLRFYFNSDGYRSISDMNHKFSFGRLEGGLTMIECLIPAKAVNTRVQKVGEHCFVHVYLGC